MLVETADTIDLGEVLSVGGSTGASLESAVRFPPSHSQ